MKKKYFHFLGLIWTLTKRDYAVQYAGTGLGLIWMFLQSTSFILLYIFIFSILNLQSIRSGNSQYLGILTGVLFWAPIQEMILKSAQVLVENRNIIKKTNVGIPLFLIVPFFQFLIHFILLAIPSFLFFFWMEELNLLGLFLGFFWMGICGLYIHPFLSYISHCNVLLKDVSPVLRIILQFGFWTLPILYTPSPYLQSILSWNPFYSMLEGFRFLILKNYNPYINWISLFVFFMLSIFFHIFSNKRMRTIVLDQL